MGNYEHFGVMIDCSRNSVMSFDGMKRFLPILKKFGYNTVLLYTEDTYEIEGEPYFGYMRGKFTMEEMKAIDDYAFSIGIEMIPCIQTLAHLNATIRWGQVPVDWDDIMLTDNDRTYEIIDHMFATLSKCFRSRLIHIGMDEAYMLGRGYHQDAHGPEAQVDIITRHLDKVRSIADKYGYSCMMWSDMFFSSWNNRCYYLNEVKKVPQSVIDSVGDHTYPVYWDYYNTDQKNYDIMMKNHAQLTPDFWFAGGAWTWMGFVPDNAFSLRGMVPAMKAARENGVKNVFFTMWGDDGGECSKFSVLPTLFYLAQFANGNEDEASIKRSFEELIGIPFDDYMQIDLPNRIKNHEKNDFCNPSKYMLFSDYFNDFLDYTVDPDVKEQYRTFAARLHEIAAKAGDFAYIFDTEAKLCDVLAVKYTLGYECRTAYEKGDKKELRRLAEEEFPKVAALLPVFGDALRRQWYLDNKTCGFDVQDLRIGGIMRRTESCAARILDYCDGKIDKIEEYEEKLLPWQEAKTPTYLNHASHYTTTNVYSH